MSNLLLCKGALGISWLIYIGILNCLNFCFCKLFELQIIHVDINIFLHNSFFILELSKLKSCRFT